MTTPNGYLVAVLAALCLPASAETARLPVTADVGIGAHPAEQTENTGGRARVRIKGNDHYYLFAFDAKPVHNWKVASAELHLKIAANALRRAAVCTVPVEWTEGAGEKGPLEGAACFTHAAWPKTPWTPRGGTLLDATFNSPIAMWRPAPLEVKDGWAVIAVAPELVEAVARGLSHGLVLAEEAGQTFENQDVFTREQSNAKPYLTVSGEPSSPARGDAEEFPAEPMPDAAGAGTGAMRIAPGKQKMAPDDSILGSRATLFQPAAKGSDPRVAVAMGGAEIIVGGLKPNAAYTVHLEIFLRSGLVLERSLLAPASQAAPTPAAPSFLPGQNIPPAKTADGWALEFAPETACVPADAAPAKTNPFETPIAARNAFAAVQAVLWPPKGKAADITIELEPLAFRGEAAVVPPPLKHAQLSRVWYVPAKDGRAQPEVLVPLAAGEKFAVPAAHAELKAPASQACQPILIDIWVPRDAAVGPYAGKLTVKAGAAVVASADIALEVAPAVLADEFRVAGSLNTYGSAARAMGVRPEQGDAFLEMERKYHRLAQAHRMALAAVPYSHSGTLSDPSVAPEVTGRGRACGVKDWSAWDRRFGPLLGGQAFSPESGYVGPAAGRGIGHMYLPFHENWPAKLADGFRPWPPPGDYDAFLRWTADLPPVASCFSADYTAAYRTVLQEFAAHLVANKWTQTHCQVYLNNKHYYRKPREDGKPPRGITLWLLDEPMFAADYEALAFFGRLTRDAAAAFKPKGLIEFRADISRPTHQRDWLDGAIDLNVVSTDLRAQEPLIQRRKRAFGEEFWNYHMPRSFTGDNAAWAAWPVQSLAWGCTGTVPWQTVGSDGDLAAASETALLYPGRKFGLAEPIPSLRMKAWRTGLQDAELLRQLQAANDWSDLQLRAFIGAFANLEGWRGGANVATGSPIATFAGYDAARIDRLRRATLAALASAKPKPTARSSALDDLRGN